MSATPGRPSDAPSLAEIEAFTAVVAQGSFSLAAERLGVAKSSVSRRVASLETRLGARLLQRSTRRMALTEAGERYHDQVVAALGALGEAADAVREVQDEPQGELRITAPVDLGGPLAALLAEFVREFPKVEVGVTLTQRRVQLVQEGFDLALRAGELEDSTLMMRRMSGGQLIVVASSGYVAEHGQPTRVSELGDHPWVLFRGQRGKMVLESEHLQVDEPVVVRGRMSGNEFGFVRRAVLADAGLGMVPDFMVDQDLQAGTLRRVLPSLSLGRSSLAIVYPSRQYVPAKVRAFCDFAVPWFACLHASPGL